MKQRSEKFEAFREWMVSQGHGELWVSDDLVAELMERNPNAKFKFHLAELQQIQSQNQQQEEVQVNIEKRLSPEDIQKLKESETSLNAAIPFDEKDFIAMGFMDAVSDPKHVKRIGKTIEAQAKLQSNIIKGNRINRHAAEVVNSTGNWAANNPKTAVAIGTVTVVAAGYGIYTLAQKYL